MTGFLRLLCLLALLCGTQAQAQDDDFAEKKQAAVTKGVRFLLDKQEQDGSWSYENTPMKIAAFPMKQGVTALCAFTLLKCGVSPEEAPIQKAFKFIHDQKLSWSYSVGCVLLAIEAKTNFDPDRKPLDDGSETGERGKKRGKMDPKDRRLAESCVAWLSNNQRKTGLWRYAGGSDEDLSCAQYAMLGLDAAERMGLKVPKSVYEKAAQRLIDTQHKGDEKVDPFPVPGADMRYGDLRKFEAKMRKDIRKVEKKFKKKETDKKGKTKGDHVAEIERRTTERILETMEKGKMIARGWSYLPEGSSTREWQKQVTGSITCSALASLFICKSRLDGTPAFKKLEKKINQALRDGAGWMAKNFSVTTNPGKSDGMHHYYYLYGLERAGILGLVHKFGKHDWYDAGARFFLGKQNGDGSWKAFAGTSGPIPDTCFALLFLARGTSPVVRIPGRVMTGNG